MVKTSLPWTGLVAALCALPSVAHAATIAQVSKSGTTITLTLSDEEQGTLSPGDKIDIQQPGAQRPLAGTVIEVNGAEARVRVAHHGGALAAGKSVSVAASDLSGMNLAPQSSADEPLPPTTAERAADSGFSSGLFHPSVVSPAQFYQVKGLRTDFETTFANDSLTVGGNDLATKATMTTPVVEGIVAYGLKGGACLGVDLRHSESAGSETYQDATVLNDNGQTTVQTYNQTAAMTSVETDVTPVVEVPLGHTGFHAAVAYEVIQRHDAGDYYAAPHDYTYAVATPAALYATSSWEAGVAYTPEVRQQSTASIGEGESTTAEIHEPAKTTLHGRAKLRAGTDAFATVAQNQNRMLNVDGESGWRNNADIMMGGDQTIGAGTTLTAALLGSTPSYQTPADNNTDRMIRYGALAGADRRVGTMKVGGLVSYETGSAHEEGVSFRHDTVEVAVTGTIRL